MALVTCVDCGKPVSDMAPACPNCGCPIAKVHSININRETENPNPGANFAALEFRNKTRKQKSGGRRFVTTVLVIGLLALAVWGGFKYFPTLNKYLPSTGETDELSTGASHNDAQEPVVFRSFPDPQGFVRTWNLLHSNNIIKGQFDQSKSMSSIRFADGLTRITYLTATHPKIAGASFSIHPRIHPFTGAMPPGANEEMMSSAIYESCTRLFSLFLPSDRNAELTVQVMSDVFAEQRKVDAFGYNFYYSEGCWVSQKGTGIFRQEGQSDEHAHASNELQSLKQEQDARIAAIRAMASDRAENVAPITANTVTPPEKVLPDGPAKILSASPAKYPPAAARAGISGDVEVQIDLDGSGNVANVSVSKSSRNRDLDRAAMDAVRTWHFSPNVIDGVGVAGRMRTTIRFHMDAQSGRIPDVETYTGQEAADIDDGTEAVDAAGPAGPQ